MDTRDNPKLRDALFGERRFKRYTFPPSAYSDFKGHVKSMYVPVSRKIPRRT